MLHNKKTYDVIIAGAGPAGALLGYLLSGSGLDVLIIEKEKFPRYKACGGGLTKRTLEILPIDVSEAIETRIYSTKICVDNRPVFTKKYTDPVISMVMRDRFDHCLVKKAIDTGSAFLDGIAFKSVSGSTGNLNIETTGETYRAKFLIGADGYNSRAAKALGLRVYRNTMIALEGEVFYDNMGAVNEFKQSVCFDFGVIPKGYGWIFPKADHLSIGVLTTMKKARSIKQYFYSYLKTKKLDINSEVRLLKGRLIPYNFCKKNIYANENGLLVGDAAGFTDPITGEGIYYAVKEALIASKIIQTALQTGAGYMEKYNTHVKKEFLKEMKYARRYANLLYSFPALSYKVMKGYGTKLGEYHLDIISGKRSYEELNKKIFNISNIIRLLKLPFHI